MMRRSFAAMIALALACLVAPASTLAQNAYIPLLLNPGTVSVIDTATNTVTGSPIPVGRQPFGVAVTPDGSKVYVANDADGTVSVIVTTTNTVTPISVGIGPVGVAATPDGSKVYVANSGSHTVSVISTATNTVTGSPIPVGGSPFGVAVTPDGSKVYVAEGSEGTVSVISTATNTVIGSPIPVGSTPFGVAVTSNGSKVYVANGGDGTVSVISTATNTVIRSPIPVGSEPFALGVFIQPPPRFAGTPGKANCYGKSVSALVRQYKGLNAAAAALGGSQAYGRCKMPYWRFAKAAVSPPTATIAMRLTTQGLAENAGDRHHKQHSILYVVVSCTRQNVEMYSESPKPPFSRKPNRCPCYASKIGLSGACDYLPLRSSPCPRGTQDIDQGCLCEGI
jgi:YVTN family beta-propeller protein